MDLHDFFRGVYPWGKLYRFLSQLPDGSRYRAAQLADEELAMGILAQEEIERRERQARGEPEPDEEKPTNVRSAVGYTPEVQLLLTLCDLVQNLTATLIAVNMPKGKQAPKVVPMARPISRLDELRKLRDELAVDESMAALGF